jgi:hypothetical protein
MTEALEDIFASTTHRTERTPVIIFLSDGESNVDDQTVQDLCRSAVRLGSLTFILSTVCRTENFSQ